MKPEFYMSDDYAGLKTKGAKFYYGYEKALCPICGKISVTNCEDHPDEECEWCFTADIDGLEKIVVPFSRLGAEDRWDVVDCCTIGIGWVLTKYKLVERD